MLSWLFGGKKQDDNGTGYGGDYWTATGNDLKKLRQGRKEAAQQELKLNASKLEYFKRTETLLKNKSLEDTSELVSTLKDTFRNHTDWKRQETLFLASLDCFRLVISNYREILGDKNDAESLYAVFEEFARHAAFLRKHDDEVHARLVKVVFQVQSMAAAAALSTAQTNDSSEHTAVMDPKESYRRALGPLRFDMCESLSHHRYSNQRKSARLNTRNMFQELSSYRTALPVEYGSSIFVRAVEGRLDLLRALIIGPDGTPYANGCFFFDIYLKNYPSEPPQVHFLTTGGGKVVFNPNLYSSGKVCLSLLGTWIGPGWVQGESTLLQVLVSIQSLIFVEKPMFNEPFISWVRISAVGKRMSRSFNVSIRRDTLKHAILPFVSGKSCYPEFDEVIQKHFYLKQMQLKHQMHCWMAEDSRIKTIVDEILSKFDVKRKANAARPPNATNDIESLVDGVSPSPVRKKHKTEQI